MMELRPCRGDDFDGVVALLRQLWPDSPPDPSPLRAVYDDALASDRRRYVCALAGGQVVGFGSVSIQGNLRQAAPFGHLEEIVVDEGHRHLGIGTRILDSLASWARERGCNRLELDSAFHREEAHAFYQAHGFRRISCHFQKPI